MSKKGAALIEFVFCAIGFFLVLMGFLYWSGTVFIQQRSLAAARFGAHLRSSGLVSDAVVRQEIRSYTDHLRLPWQGSFDIHMGRYRQTPASHFYHLSYAQVQFRPSDSSRPVINEWVVIQNEDTD